MAGVAGAAQAPRRLEGKVALITGAARGCGECIARVFVKHGAKIVCADIDKKKGEEVCEDIGSENATFVYCDVSEESDVENAVNVAVEKYGKLDIMVNNAGILDEMEPSIFDNTFSNFERVIKVNLGGPFLGIKHAARVMIPARSGSVITLGSVSASVGGATSHAYTSSKHGVVGLTRNAAAELGNHGIRVNCLSSYLVLTAMANTLLQIKYKDHAQVPTIYSNLQGIYLQLEDVANAAVYLASDESRYMSGHNLALDGGYTAINPAFGLFSKF